MRHSVISKHYATSDYQYLSTQHTYAWSVPVASGHNLITLEKRTTPPNTHNNKTQTHTNEWRKNNHPASVFTRAARCERTDLIRAGVPLFHHTPHHLYDTRAVATPVKRDLATVLWMAARQWCGLNVCVHRTHELLCMLIVHHISTYYFVCVCARLIWARGLNLWWIRERSNIKPFLRTHLMRSTNTAMGLINSKGAPNI